MDSPARRHSGERDPALSGEPLALLTTLGPHALTAAMGASHNAPHHHPHLSPHHGQNDSHGHQQQQQQQQGRDRAGSSTTAGVTIEDSVSLATGTVGAHVQLISAHSIVGGGTGLGSGAAGGAAGGSGQHPRTVQFDLSVMRAARKSTEELKAMKKPLRQFYAEQNERIDFYEDVEERRAHAAAESEAALKRQASAAIAKKAAAAAAAADVESGTSAAVTPSTVVVATSGGAIAPSDGDVKGENGGSASSSASGSGDNESSLTARADAKEAFQRRIDRWVATAINVSFAANVCLLAIKVYAAASSNSLAVIASTVDSVMDLISGMVVWLSSWLASRRNPYLFPIGKSRYEPISIIVFAALMGAASLQLISQGVTNLIDGIANGGGNTSIDERTYGVLAAIIALKGSLYVFCTSLKKYSSSVGALALDHFADVITNGGPLIAVLCAHYYPFLWWFDPAMAIIMSVYMVWMWADAAKTQIALITGQVATSREIGEITFLALTHSPAILAVDTVLAYQLGNKLQAEVDIVMPRHTLLEESHDVGESLQRKIEELQNVERCFVHIDYEWLDHKKDDEHYNPYEQPSYAPPE